MGLACVLLEESVGNVYLSGHKIAEERDHDHEDEPVDVPEQPQRSDSMHATSSDTTSHATDGEIGKIDEAPPTLSRQYLVVDTGFWIFGKKRMIPAGVVSSVDHDDKKVSVTMSKDQIKAGAGLSTGKSRYDERDYDRFGDYYGDYGW